MFEHRLICIQRLRIIILTNINNACLRKKNEFYLIFEIHVRSPFRPFRYFFQSLKIAASKLEELFCFKINKKHNYKSDARAMSNSASTEILASPPKTRRGFEIIHTIEFRRNLDSKSK